MPKSSSSLNIVYWLTKIGQAVVAVGLVALAAWLCTLAAVRFLLPILGFMGPGWLGLACIALPILIGQYLHMKSPNDSEHAKYLRGAKHKHGPDR